MSGSFRLSVREKNEIVKCYAIYQTAVEVARQFHKCFDRTPPTSKSLLSLVKKFDEIGSLENQPRSGRLRTISTEENKQRVLKAYEANPTTSQRRVSLELDLSRSSLQRMMTELERKPFRPQLLQALNKDDPDRLCEFASISLDALVEDSSLLDRIVWTDAAIFKLNGHVNRHNCVYHATENLHAIMTQEMNSSGITVWAGLWVGGIIGPFFFDGGNVNASNYLEMRQKQIIPTIEREEWTSKKQFICITEHRPITTELSDNIWTKHFLIGGLVDTITGSHTT